MPGELVRLAPGEVLAVDDVLGDALIKSWIGQAGAAATPVAGQSFDPVAGERLLKAQLGVTDLAGFGAFARSELAAIGALLKYVELTQLGKAADAATAEEIGPRRGAGDRCGDAHESRTAAFNHGGESRQPAWRY